MNRSRVNFAWALRAVAKALNARADRIDPIKAPRGYITKDAMRAHLHDDATDVPGMEKCRAKFSTAQSCPRCMVRMAYGLAPGEWLCPGCGHKHFTRRT